MSQNDEDRLDDDLSDEEFDQLWAEEAERRFAEYKAGNMESAPAEEVFARSVAALSLASL